LKYSLSIPVVNKAIAGRSARSYTVEGHFDQVAALVKPEDFVLMEVRDGQFILSETQGSRYFWLLVSDIHDVVQVV
jgi:hypothetical protein